MLNEQLKIGLSMGNNLTVSGNRGDIITCISLGLTNSRACLLMAWKAALGA